MVERLKEFLGFLIELTGDGLQWEKDPYFYVYTAEPREYKLVVDGEKIVRIVKYDDDTNNLSLTLFPGTEYELKIRQGREGCSNSLNELLDDLYAEIKYSELGAERKEWIQNNIDRLIIQLGG